MDPFAGEWEELAAAQQSREQPQPRQLDRALEAEDAAEQQLAKPGPGHTAAATSTSLRNAHRARPCAQSVDRVLSRCSFV